VPVDDEEEAAMNPASDDSGSGAHRDKPASVPSARERIVERPRSFEVWWERLVSLPELVRVVHLHAPVALAGGRTPVEIVASGVGVLIVDDTHHFVWGVFHRTLHIRVQPRVTVRFIGLAGIREQVLSLESVVTETPRRIVVKSDGLPLFDGDEAVVHVRAPRPLPVAIEALAPSRAPLRALASVRSTVEPMRTRVNDSVFKLSARTRALSLRIRLPGGPDDSP
jgi:hypothetical protein